MKLVMDYWCALWFWPIEQAELLPSREELLFEVGVLLRGNVFEPGITEAQLALQFGEEYAELDRRQSLDVTDRFGVLDLQKVFASFPRLALGDALARHLRFHHWELAFADVFAQRGCRPGRSRLPGRGGLTALNG